MEGYSGIFTILDAAFRHITTMADWRSMKTLIHSSNIPMYFLNRELEVVYANAHIARLLGVSRKSMRGMSLYQIIMHAANQVVEEERKRFYREQEAFSNSVMEDLVSHLETQMTFRLKADGKKITFWIHADVLYKNDKRFGVFVMIIPMDPEREGYVIEQV